MISLDTQLYRFNLIVRLNIMKFLIFVLVYYYPLNVYAQDSSCDKLLEHGISNIYQATSHSYYADTIHDQYCKESYESHSRKKQNALSVAYEGLDFSWSDKRASAKTKHNEFCRDYKRTTNIGSHTFRVANELHSNAIDAWERCITLKSSGLLIDHTTSNDFTNTSFTMRYTGAGDGIKFQGINSKNMSCTLDGQVVTAAEDWLIKPQARTVTCERDMKKQTVGGVIYTYYPSANVTIKTALENYTYDVIEMLDSPAKDRFASLETQIAKLISRNQKLKEVLLAPTFLDVSSSGGCLCGKSRPSCPDGYKDTHIGYTDSYKGCGCGMGSIHTFCYKYDIDKLE